MKEADVLSSKVLNLKKWQAVQDAIAQQTKLAIVTVDYKGDTLTEHSGCNAFCKAIRDRPELAHHCKKCDSRGGLEAVRLNKAYIYLCHFDIVDIAIPIIINNYYAGAIMAGQVRLADKHDLENIYTMPKGSEFALSDELRNLYEELPILTYEAIDKATQMLNNICNYVVDESQSKNVLIEMYERLYSYEKTNALGALENMKSELNAAITNAYIDNSVSGTLNPVIKPAIEYIRKHVSEDITLSMLGKICCVSTGYLSRLFVKETGDTYTDYHNKTKIDMACDMLKNTALSMAAISDNLGFSDPSYFNRVFKKFRNTTPALYRKFNR